DDGAGGRVFVPSAGGATRKRASRAWPRNLSNEVTPPEKPLAAHPKDRCARPGVGRGAATPYHEAAGDGAPASVPKLLGHQQQPFPASHRNQERVTGVWRQ